MARFALRNQKKIEEKLGSQFLYWLKESLKQHFANHPEIKTEDRYTNEPYPVIFVENVQPKTDSTFEFYIIAKVYDVYNLAYKGVMG